MAFHLHRLRLTGKPLHHALNGKVHTSTALAQARQPLSEPAVIALAELLAIDAQELLRALTEPETREWAFYRISAQNRQHVLNAAKSQWENFGFTTKDAARTMNIHRTRLIDSLMGKRPLILDWQHATRLLDAIHSSAPPEVLLPYNEWNRDRA